MKHWSWQHPTLTTRALADVKRSWTDVTAKGSEPGILSVGIALNLGMEHYHNHLVIELLPSSSEANLTAFFGPYGSDSSHADPLPIQRLGIGGSVFVLELTHVCNQERSLFLLLLNITVIVTSPSPPARPYRHEQLMLRSPHIHPQAHDAHSPPLWPLAGDIPTARRCKRLRLCAACVSAHPILG